MRSIVPFVLLSLVLAACARGQRPTSAGVGSGRRPNVVLVMTDDQGFGDVGVHGNDQIRTPNLDAFARQGTQLTRFYVSPVCSPTRASLMTGRYNYRTRAIDTYLGRSMMDAEEVTVAELLRAAGYRTAIFGKWHLGDNYPLRAMDQGFEEALVLKGGGIGQPSDPPGGDSYFDPTLYANGRAVRTKGYCSDIYTDAAIDFMRRHGDQPFFVYLPYNAPHTPLEVPESYRRRYAEMGLPDQTARVYGMVENIDDNFGRLLRTLDELGLARDTIVIFMTDNGPQQDRYNAGMRGKKSTPFEGGIRVPGFVRWPAALAPGRTIDRVAAHIDITPTLLDAAGVAPPADLRLDGRSLLPLLRGTAEDWPERSIFIQWHRGDEALPRRNFAVVSQRWKLVGPQADPPLLFDLVADPGEKHDLAAAQPEVAARFLAEYDRWFADVSRTRGFDPPRIHVGSSRENPVVLTRQDWRGPRAGWTPESLGHWEIDVVSAGSYDVRLRFRRAAGGTASLRLGGLTLSAPVTDGAQTIEFPAVALPRGPGRLEPEIAIGGQTVGVDYVEIARR